MHGPRKLGFGQEEEAREGEPLRLEVVVQALAGERNIEAQHMCIDLYMYMYICI